MQSRAILVIPFLVALGCGGTPHPRPAAPPRPLPEGCAAQVVVGYDECERWYNDPGSSNFLLLMVGDVSGSWKTRIDCKQAVVDKLTESQQKLNACIEDARQKEADAKKRMADAQAEQQKLERDGQRIDQQIAALKKTGKDTEALVREQRALQQKLREAQRQAHTQEQTKDEMKRVLDDLCMRGICPQGDGK